MAVELNHIIIPSHDKVRSSRFLAEILGIDPPQAAGHFMTVRVSNGVTLDYDDADEFQSQHCAFRGRRGRIRRDLRKSYRRRNQFLRRPFSPPRR
jgi:hypothetical protein